MLNPIKFKWSVLKHFMFLDNNLLTPKLMIVALQQTIFDALWCIPEIRRRPEVRPVQAGLLPPGPERPRWLHPVLLFWGLLRLWQRRLGSCARQYYWGFCCCFCFCFGVSSVCDSADWALVYVSVTGVFVFVLMCTFRASCYSIRMSWAHTPVTNWAVCLGQMVSS